MREIHADLAPYWLGALVEVSGADGGPTEELSDIITDPGSRARLVQTMIVLELARHPASDELAASVEFADRIDALRYCPAGSLDGRSSTSQFIVGKEFS